VVAPVLEGQEQELEDTLLALPAGTQSPLEGVDGLHFARWVIVPHLEYGAEPQPRDRLERQLLVFTCTFDGTLDRHVGELLAGLGQTADDVWRHCDGWPGRANARAWLLDHRVRTGLFVAAYPKATREEVRGALAAREKLLNLAEDTQHGDPQGKRRDFLERFASST